MPSAQAAISATHPHPPKAFIRKGTKHETRERFARGFHGKAVAVSVFDKGNACGKNIPIHKSPARFGTGLKGYRHPSGRWVWTYQAIKTAIVYSDGEVVGPGSGSGVGIGVGSGFA